MISLVYTHLNTNNKHSHIYTDTHREINDDMLLLPNIVLPTVLNVSAIALDVYVGVTCGVISPWWGL